MHALFPSFLAGLATAFGSLLVLFGKRPGPRTLAVLLGGAAGVMLAVVLLDLIPAALRTGNGYQATSGFVAGSCFLWCLELLISRKRSRIPLNSKIFYRRMGYLMATGIAMHDLPEGIAIAGAYTAGGSLGPLLAISIAIHNIPEGIATTAPLQMGGLRKRWAFFINLFVSLFTPAGTLLGLFIIHLSPQHLSFLLSLAAGAMTYLIKCELIPTARYQSPIWGWVGLVSGYILLWFAQCLK